jgi:hypothetical protein
MNRVEEYVSRLSDDEKKLIISENEQFERDGFIGDCFLRQSARSFMRDLGVSGDTNIVLWMNQLSVEAYKVFAKRYLSQ